jgi:hypothetical protein
MRLNADDIEAAFVETAREQVSGEPFNWQRVALHLNERLADHLLGRSRFMLKRPPDWAGAEGDDGADDGEAE